MQKSPSHDWLGLLRYEIVRMGSEAIPTTGCCRPTFDRTVVRSLVGKGQEESDQIGCHLGIQLRQIRPVVSGLAVFGDSGLGDDLCHRHLDPIEFDGTVGVDLLAVKQDGGRLELLVADGIVGVCCSGHCLVLSLC